MKQEIRTQLGERVSFGDEVLIHREYQQYRWRY